MTHLLTPSFREQDNEKKLALRAELVAVALPREFGNLEVRCRRTYLLSLSMAQH